MRTNPNPESVVREIRRKTRKKYSTEEKIRIVLEGPEPFAIFNGFGDNFLDFTLYFWIYTSNYFKAKNEVALTVHDTLKAQGISTPRPQRDVRLTNGDASKSGKSVTKKPITKNTK